MRFEGTLTQWNEDRGFGFIEAAQTRERVFVHISAFERGRVRPPLGARLTFGVERDAQGRRRAVDVVMPGDTLAAPARAPARPPRGIARAGRRRSPAWAVFAVICVVAAVVVRPARFARGPESATMTEPPAATAAAPATEMPAASQPFRCDGRTYCSQMHSCAEATWVSNHCPGTKMDGNHDGVPCERQWCTGER